MIRYYIYTIYIHTPTLHEFIIICYMDGMDGMDVAVGAPILMLRAQVDCLMALLLSAIPTLASQAWAKKNHLNHMYTVIVTYRVGEASQR